MNWKFENADGSFYVVRNYPTVQGMIKYARTLAHLSGDIVMVYRESLLADQAIGDKEKWHYYGYSYGNSFNRNRC